MKPTKAERDALRERKRLNKQAERTRYREANMKQHHVLIPNKPGAIAEIEVEAKRITRKYK